MLINGFIKETIKRVFSSPRAKAFFSFLFFVLVVVVVFRVIDGGRRDDIWPAPGSLKGEETVCEASAGCSSRKSRRLF